ncbi:MAG: Tetratricopeptide 1 repeat-containing protein [Fibrobacteres bacterium]|nr:Tetratricopeptide 1 repeat-containing protein [Fibrobacterota bacterium]
MSAGIERAQLLISQSRFDMAEKELRAALAETDGDYRAHSLLAYCLIRLGRLPEALAESGAAVSKDPGAPYPYYIRALALMESGKREEAMAAIREAIRLDPSEADYFALLAGIHLDGKKWDQALKSAESALLLDAEHVQAANVRAVALMRLDRGAEAGETLDSALAREPESPITHANMGWTLLERRDHKKALEHFREALRLDPEQEWAREGIVESMKARNGFYRLMLQYFFFMSKLPAKGQWAVVIIALIGTRLLRATAHAYPPFEPAALVIGAMYVLFMAATWLARPLFDLVLRLDRFGRLCLSRDQIKGSDWLGLTLLVAAAFLALSFAMGYGVLLGAAIGSLALCVPVAGIYQTPNPQRRRFRAAYSIGLAALGIAALVLPAEAHRTMAGGLFVAGLIVYTWIANL